MEVVFLFGWRSGLPLQAAFAHNYILEAVWNADAAIFVTQWNFSQIRGIIVSCLNGKPGFGGTIVKDIIDYIQKTYTPMALIVYGSFADGSNNINSDFDALVITSDAEKRHDHSIIHGTQLDVFVYPPEIFSKPYDPDEFLQIWDGKILIDSDGLALSLKQTVNDYIRGLPAKSDEENKHHAVWCQKMLSRAERGDAEGCYRLYWLLKDSLEIYFDLKHWQYFGPKKGLKKMRADDETAALIYEQALKAPTIEHVRTWVDFLQSLIPA